MSKIGASNDSAAPGHRRSPDDREARVGTAPSSLSVWPLAIALLVGAALRCYRLGGNSLWIDEFMTLWIAQRSPADIVTLSSTVNLIPPLYFLLVHAVLHLFGESEVSLRLVSVVAGVGTIPVLWYLTEEIARSRRAADFAAALLAVNPLHLWFSQEARPYALLLFFGCCSLLALERATRTNRPAHWITFALCGVLTFLTHTTGLIFGVIAIAWSLRSSDRWRAVRPVFAWSFVAVAVSAPFFISVARALAAAHGKLGSAPRALTGLEVGYTLLTFVTGFSFGPALREIQNVGGLAALRGHPIETAVAGVALLGLFAVSVVNRRAAMGPFLAMLAISLGGILALSALTGKAFNVRYALPALIGFAGTISVAVSALAPVPRKVALSTLLGLALWADVQWFRSPLYWKEDSRAAVAWLHERLAPGATVAVAPAYNIRPLAYYARRTGVDIRFVPAVSGPTRSDGPTSDALLLTRLHHVPNWRTLKAGFATRTDGEVVEGRVAGYDMLVKGPAR
jgi:4-amino-4-deoxy-L-arabinose transferase-like glycosyltransferase